MSYDHLWNRYQQSVMQSQELRKANSLLAGHDEQDLEDFRFRVADGGAGGDHLFHQQLQHHNDDAFVDDDAHFAGQIMASSGEEHLFDAGGGGGGDGGSNEDTDLINICTDINDLLGRHSRPHAEPTNNNNDNGDDKITHDNGVEEEEEEEMLVEHRDDAPVEEPSFFVNSPLPPHMATVVQQPESEHPVEQPPTDIDDEQYYIALLLQVIKRGIDSRVGREEALTSRIALFDADLETFSQQRVKDNNPMHRMTLYMAQARSEIRAAQMRQLNSTQIQRLVKHLDHLAVLADLALLPGGGGLYHAQLGPYLILLFGGSDDNNDSYVMIHEDYC